MFVVLCFLLSPFVCFVFKLFGLLCLFIFRVVFWCCFVSFPFVFVSLVLLLFGLRLFVPLFSRYMVSCCLLFVLFYLCVAVFVYCLCFILALFCFVIVVLLLAVLYSFCIVVVFAPVVLLFSVFLCFCLVCFVVCFCIAVFVYCLCCLSGLF